MGKRPNVAPRAPENANCFGSAPLPNTNKSASQCKNNVVIDQIIMRGLSVEKERLPAEDLEKRIDDLLVSPRTHCGSNLLEHCNRLKTSTIYTHFTLKSNLNNSHHSGQVQKCINQAMRFL